MVGSKKGQYAMEFLMSLVLASVVLVMVIGYIYSTHNDQTMQNEETKKKAECIKIASVLGIIQKGTSIALEIDNDITIDNETIYLDDVACTHYSNSTTYPIVLTKGTYTITKTQTEVLIS